MRSLSIDGVFDWAMKTAGLDLEDATILRDQKIDGDQLFELTKQELISFKMPWGSAIRLMRALAPYSAAAAAAAPAAAPGLYSSIALDAFRPAAPAAAAAAAAAPGPAGQSAQA